MDVLLKNSKVRWTLLFFKSTAPSGISSRSEAKQ